MGDNKKKDNRSFCFCMHAQVDCLPGVVLDCNNHKREVCPLVEEVLAVNKDKEKQVNALKEKFKNKDSKAQVAEDTKKEEKKPDKKKDNRSFCFCMHSQVDCSPGVVLDCNNHKREVCPLVEEVLSVNKDNELKVSELKEKFKKKDEKTKDKKEEKAENKKASEAKEKKTEKKKDNRSFCFCMHSQVDCSPGVVLDCNNHKREVCPLVEEVLSVNKDKELKVSELKEKFMKKDDKTKEKKEDKGDSKKAAETKEKKATKKKDNRSFCFCLGAQVDCLPGVVLDCNNHKRTICPVLLEALPYNEEQKAKVKEIIVMSKNGKA